MNSAGWILVLLLLGSGSAWSQERVLTGFVRDLQSNDPLPFVNVRTEGNQGTQTDSSGYFQLRARSDAQFLLFSFLGYESRQFPIHHLKGEIEIHLKESLTRLDEVKVSPGENPAWRIIRQVQRHQDKNDPLNFSEFQALAYTKVKVRIGDIVPKDTTRAKDWLKPLFAEKDAPSQDYANLLLLENSGNFYFKNRQRKEIVNYSITNVPKAIPVNLLLSNEQNPLGFYQPFFRLSLFNESGNVNSPGIERNYVNPLKNGTFGYYEFELTDTTINGRDSVFTIAFQPIGTSREALAGSLQVSTDGWALTAIRVHNADSTQVLAFEIEQKYEKEGKRWYPVKRTLNYRYDYQTSSVSAKITVKHYQEFRNIQSFVGKGEVYFDGSNRELTARADTITLEDFEKYRFHSLTADEELTYKRAKLESKPAFKKGMDFMEWPSKILMQASAPIGPFLLILDQNLMNFHEFARIGLGIQRNLLDYPRFGFRASAGYGLRDKALKYRLSASWHITKDRYNRLSLYEVKDIRPPGQVTFLGPNYSTPYPQYLYFNREGYLADRFLSRGISLYTRPLRWTWFRFFAEDQQVSPVNYDPEELSRSSQTYRNFGLMMRFARKETFIRNGFFETVQTNYFPVLHANLSRSYLKNNNSNFSTFTFNITHRIRWKRIGYDMIKLEGGQSWGDVPYNFLFNNLGGGRGFFGLQRQGFVTGNFLDYVSNRYVFLDFVHHFGKNLIKTSSSWFQPQIAVGHRYSYSVLDDAAAPSGIDLGAFRRGQSELNLYLRNLIVFPVFGFRAGLGIDLAYNYSADFSGKRRWAVLPAVTPAFF